MNVKNLSDVREVLARRLAELDDTSRKVDLVRARATVEVSDAIVNTLKVELALSTLLKGALAVPFVELPERENESFGADTAQLPPPAVVASGQAAPAAAVPSQPGNTRSSRKNPLTAGPAPSHPWRSSVHRMQR
ncbi:hypothetical protein [Variovorax sp.]|uniref:hypothetical protein n=1 Tax=Variovorax sp. TaxID=1871043 RepID=UPI003BABE85C